MNISIKSKREKDSLIAYLIKSQKELIEECHEDYKTSKVQEVISKLKNRNKIQNGI